MRKGLTLIELIFTMAIVAFVFSVIPKLVKTMAQSSKAVIKEDAIFNTITLMGLIKNLAWDKNNVTNDSILKVTNEDTKYTCNQATGYRVGGFIGGRNCIDTANASTITNTSTIYNSIDSYNGYKLDTKTSCNNKLYNLGIKVKYQTGSTCNIKHIQITTNYDDSFKLKGDGCTIFDYFSYNLGQVHINKRAWK